MIRRLITISLQHGLRTNIRKSVPNFAVNVASAPKYGINCTRSFTSDISFESSSEETLDSLCERLEILIDEDPKLGMK